MYGYMGNYVIINLSLKTIHLHRFDEVFARTWLGGNGFAARLIHELVPAHSDALSEENAVVFALGPLNGTPVWGTSRGHLAAISPQTGFFMDSNFGGNFADMLKKTGHDAIVITGRSSTPVYISITEDDIAIKPANDLWGKTVGETHQCLLRAEGDSIESAIIGPAGENGVVFANVMCSGHRKSAAGRGGIGAVLGWKNCKAVVAKGSRRPDIARPEELNSFLKTHFSNLKIRTQGIAEFGTPVILSGINAKGMLCTRNNTREIFDGAESLSAPSLCATYKTGSSACKGCPVACAKTVYVPEGEFSGRQVKMPEYETLFSMGSMLDNSDAVSIFNANTLCDDLGMDTISFGVSLAFLAECVERHIVDETVLGMPVRFADGSRLPELVRKTAYRQGPGRYLAMGSARMAQCIGNESEKLLYCTKGLEIAGHSARGLRSMGLAYATSTRGGSHQDARPRYMDPEMDAGFEDQHEYCLKSQNCSAIGDSLVICRFISERAFGKMLNARYVSLIAAVTGWDITLEELNLMGERIYTLERLINTRRGADRAMDRLPHRVLHVPIPDGPAKGRHCSQENLDQMLDRYYALRGWDGNGIPTPEKLSELGLLDRK